MHHINSFTSTCNSTCTLFVVLYWVNLEIPNITLYWTDSLDGLFVGGILNHSIQYQSNVNPWRLFVQFSNANSIPAFIPIIKSNQIKYILPMMSEFQVRFIKKMFCVKHGNESTWWYWQLVWYIYKMAENRENREKGSIQIRSLHLLKKESLKR